VNYFVTREGQQYGPYTLSDLQRYVGTGEVLLTDLATSDALTEPVPVSQIVGNIAATPTSFSSASASALAVYPDPPNLQWGLVLLFSVLSCGLFTMAWDLVQAAWMKRVEPTSKAIFYYGAGAAAIFCIFGVSFVTAFNHTGPSPLVSLFQLASSVLFLVGRFSLKSSLEDHFNGAEPIGLSLSGVMTFFFGGIYFQYHINDIVRRKAADVAWEAAR
jgi:hypothetical protein